MEADTFKTVIINFSPKTILVHFNYCVDVLIAQIGYVERFWCYDRQSTAVLF